MEFLMIFLASFVGSSIAIIANEVLFRIKVAKAYGCWNKVSKKDDNAE